jgi:hypothetical protein
VCGSRILQQRLATGTSLNSSSTYLVGAEFLGTGAKVGVTFTFNYTETRTASSGDQKVATLTLKTPTVCFVMDVDVYIDAAFGTYATVPTATHLCTDPYLVAGVLTDAAGLPLANKPLTVQTGKGPVTVYTNADGSYKVF